jgi:hypothetical protein
MDIKQLSAVLGTSLFLGAGFVQAEPFVFQGQLNEAGSPASGVYDLAFDIYNVETGGAAIAGTVVVDDLEVTNGNFTVELDFGDVFDGSSRWITINVRDGADTGPYTLLDPRAKVGSSPQASFASTAGSAAVADTLSDPFWSEAPGILFFGEDNGQDQFFFNRNRDVDATDVMVVQSNQNGFGGITISSWINGMPYFGHATGGLMRVKTYYDPATDAWVVNKNGDQLEIDQNNDVIITNNLVVGGTITALGGSGEPTIGYRSFTPESLFIGLSNSNTVFNSFAGAVVAQGSPQYLRAGLNLPHGSSITKIEVIYVDQQVNPNLRVELFTRDLASMTFTTTLLGESSGSVVGSTQTMVIEPGTPILIDNTLQTYNLRMIPSTGSWPSVGNLGVRSVLIEYTQP